MIFKQPALEKLACQKGGRDYDEVRHFVANFWHKLTQVVYGQIDK